MVFSHRPLYYAQICSLSHITWRRSSKPAPAGAHGFHSNCNLCRFAVNLHPTTQTNHPSNAPPAGRNKPSRTCILPCCHHSLPSRLNARSCSPRNCNRRSDTCSNGGSCRFCIPTTDCVPAPRSFYIRNPYRKHPHIKP